MPRAGRGERPLCPCSIRARSVRKCRRGGGHTRCQGSASRAGAGLSRRFRCRGRRRPRGSMVTAQVSPAGPGPTPGVPPNPGPRGVRREPPRGAAAARDRSASAGPPLPRCRRVRQPGAAAVRASPAGCRPGRRRVSPALELGIRGAPGPVPGVAAAGRWVPLGSRPRRPGSGTAVGAARRQLEVTRVTISDNRCAAAEVAAGPLVGLRRAGRA